jgi:hypothetical protein
MEKEDQFDKETGFDVAISEAGISVRTKSRIVSTLDRWGGNFFRKKSFKGERAVQTDEQLISLEAKIVQKAGEKLLKRVDEDDDFALEVLNIAYSREARRRDNKEGVILAALEILKNETASENESLEGPETLSDEFLDRVERYAEDASTDELKQRWGRILAGEIRKPGTFSRKVLRAVDELDAETALLFERVAAFSLGGCLPICLVKKLTFDEQAALASAGMILEPGLGHWRLYNKVKISEKEFWFCDLGEYAVAFPVVLDGVTTSDDESSALGKHEENFAFPVYSLSDVGKAVTTIIPDQTFDAFNKYLVQLIKHVPLISLVTYRNDRDGKMWIRMGSPDYAARWPG